MDHGTGRLIRMDKTAKPCCAPARGADNGTPVALPDRPAQHGADFAHDTVLIPGGASFRGTNLQIFKVDEEGPLRRRQIKPFRMGRTSVTNAEFARFVDATGYVTETEAWGWSFVFHLQVPAALGKTQSVPGLDWWRRVDGSSWRDINGPGTAAQVWHPDHPVVQVSWRDATAYADWAGGRLPSEAEWEHAARGGLQDARYPWGDREPDDTDFMPCNIWQGSFPHHNTSADGYPTTAPAQSFEPNGYGLYNMCGNVWEWTRDDFRLKSLKRGAKQRMQEQKGWKVTKGGSFLCHRSYCHRYRIAARSSNAPDSATPHIGFRVVWDA